MTLLEMAMIDYEKIHYCLMYIINECESGTDCKDIIENVLKKAKNAITIIEENNNE